MNGQDNKKFRGALSISGILHLILMILFFFGSPLMFEKLPDQPEVMTFEVVSISEINNIKTEDIVAKKEITPEKSIEVKKAATTKKIETPIPLEAKQEKKVEENIPPVKETKPEEPEPKDAEPIKKDEAKEEVREEIKPEKKEEVEIIPEEKKKEEEKPKEPKESEPVPQKEPKKSPEKEPEKKAALPEDKRPEDKKKDLPKKVEPTPKKELPKPKNNAVIADKDEDSIDSILNNIEDESVGDDGKKLKKSTNEQKEGKQKAKGNEYNEDLPLSITEINLIKNRIKKNFHPPIGAKNIDKIQVHMRIIIEKDGTVKDVAVEKTNCPSDVTASICKQVADSAVRAVWQASPFENLPIARYDIWKNNSLIFVPNSWDF